MTHLEQAIDFIKEIFRNASSVGTSFNQRDLIQARIKLNPPVYDELQEAFNHLIHEGFLTNDLNLTDKGFKELFPSNLSHARTKLINELKAQRLEEGHVVNSRSLAHNLFMKANDQEKDDYQIVLDNLISEGFLEEDNDKLKLSKYGYENLY